MNPNSMYDDDIEEGEIIESDSLDTDITIPSSSKPRKSLPRRYVLAENKKLHSKNRRKCKHSHHHVKKAKLKKSPMKPKDHKKKFCSKHSPLNNSVAKAILTKSSLLNSQNVENYNNSLLSEISSSLKTLKDIDKKVNNSLLHSSVSKCTSLKQVDFPKFLSSYSKLQDNSKKSTPSEIKSSSIINPEPSDQNRLHVNVGEVIANESKELEVLNPSDFPPSLKSEWKKEESEDEDELRRIALATCTKKLVPEVKIEEKEEMHYCPDNQIDAVPSPQSNIKPVTDNYEIVDMELDDCPIGSVKDLFVIDTKPSVLGEFSKDCSLEANDNMNSSGPLDEEFEEEFLRAVLLAGLNSQKKSKDSDEIQQDDVQHERVQENNKAVEKLISKPQPTKEPSLPSREVAPSTLPIKKVNAKALQPLKVQLDNTSQITQKRIIISLNDESSSDESDAEVENNGPSSTSCVSGLEALICNARKKSDQSKPDTKGTNVSYLSKAQQEEYKLYKKILSANGGEQALINKNSFLQLPKYELKLKEKKLLIALSNCTKEKNLMKNETAEVLKKRSEFMKVKLKSQQLKEEWMESKKMMKTKMLLYQKSLNHLKTLKKSVMKREELISNLKIECTDLGVTIEGKKYVLPAVSATQTPLLVDKTNS